MVLTLFKMCPSKLGGKSYCWQSLMLIINTALAAWWMILPGFTYGSSIHLVSSVFYSSWLSTFNIGFTVLYLNVTVETKKNWSRLIVNTTHHRRKHIWWKKLFFFTWDFICVVILNLEGFYFCQIWWIYLASFLNFISTVT